MAATKMDIVTYVEDHTGIVLGVEVTEEEQCFDIPLEKGLKKQMNKALSELVEDIASIEQEIAMLRGKKQLHSEPTTTTASVVPSLDSDPASPSTSSPVPPVPPVSFDFTEEIVGEGTLPPPFYTELMNSSYVWDWDAEFDKAGDSSPPSSPSATPLFNSSAEEGRNSLRGPAKLALKRARSRSAERAAAAVAAAVSGFIGGEVTPPAGSKRRRTASRSSKSNTPVTAAATTNNRRRSSAAVAALDAALASAAGDSLSPLRGGRKKMGGGNRRAVKALEMSWTREQLLDKIMHELPCEKLHGIVAIVNPSFEISESDDEADLEFDIGTLDEKTLYKLQQYVQGCLGAPSSVSEKRVKQTKQRTRAQKQRHPKSQRRKKSPINVKYNYIPHVRGKAFCAQATEMELFQSEVIVKVEDGDTDEHIDIESL